MEVQMFTVGVVQENCFVFHNDGSDKALIVDPGDEPDTIMAPVREHGLTVEAILLTHCHFDHIGAVAPIAKETGAPVYCPRIEEALLTDIMAFIPYAGIGPFENHKPEVLIDGGEKLELAGFDIDVIFTPGHSPGHVTYSIPEEKAIFSGDVLFQGSIGRTDLPGGDGPTLMQTLTDLTVRFDDDTDVYPGHMGTTTIGAERATNPFLSQLAG